MPLRSTLIKTPLGELEFSVSADGALPAAVSLDTAPFRPRIPPGMSVLACYGIVLQLKASTPVNNVTFKAFINAACPASEGPATGEGLEAQEWANGDYVMLIGTEDVDYLRIRLPSTIDLPGNPFTYSNDSLSVRVSKIPRGETLTLHFIVAWNKLPEPVGLSCWFAVDQPHLTVLSSLKV